MRETAIRQIRKALGDAKVNEEEARDKKAITMVQAKYLHITDQYRCKINLAQSNDEKLRLAIECISNLTGDRLFYEMNTKKG